MSADPLQRGPVVIDIEGLELSPVECERLAHPLVGGVILFARNYASPDQVRALTASLRALRDPALVIAVDHEGGRVQRFRDGFTAIPAMRTLGETWDRDIAAAAAEAQRLGRVMATELRACGVDLSFTPVLDLDYGSSGVIGDRAFHRNPNAVAHLAAALCDGLRDGGLAAVGKHFPGHGYVRADSHTHVPVDERDLAALIADDLVPFGALIERGLEGIMPAHVIYPAVDAVPAGFSSRWLQEILRGRYGFDGMVFSDDLAMAGARVAGDMVARAQAATAAGCDVVLVCNDPAGADEVLSRWRPAPSAALDGRWSRIASPGPRSPRRSD